LVKVFGCRQASENLHQHGNPEVNLRDAIAKIAEGHLINRIAEPNTMATINRTLIQLLSSDAYARGAAYPSGWHRPVGPAGVSGGHLGWNADRGAHAALP
jgi:hypothetical protein